MFKCPECGEEKMYLHTSEKCLDCWKKTMTWAGKGDDPKRFEEEHTAAKTAQTR